MSVSANTLFHFTKFTTLQNILISKGFWPQYSLEHFANALPKASKYYAAHIPMVCFCDLKLTQLSDTSISYHTMHFGRYGIGFKKEWGIFNKISPVSYVHENSIASTTIDNVITTINKSALASDKTLTTNLGEIVKFLKPYRGFYQKGKKQIDSITYYDEREWRYIPKEKKYEVFPLGTLGIRKIIDDFNKELQGKSLKFSYDDIRYIITDTEFDKESLIKFFRSKKFTDKDREYLLSKIISISEIRENF